MVPNDDDQIFEVTQTAEPSQDTTISSSGPSLDSVGSSHFMAQTLYPNAILARRQIPRQVRPGVLARAVNPVFKPPHAPLLFVALSLDSIQQLT